MENSEASKIISSNGRFNQRIVICGSMKYFEDMLEIQRTLNERNVSSIVPKSEGDYVQSLSKEEFSKFKRNVSYQYLKEIRNPKTLAILVVNKDKHGIPDYIGPNTFAEIAVAFAQSKRIFLLQSIPAQYQDELEAWRAISLDGSHVELFSYYKSNYENSIKQLGLFG